MIQFLILPFIACLILTGIHVYFGLHVVARKVIFVDLALAQMAALGTTTAFLMGYDLHSLPAYFISLGFTLVGAALFALTRTRGDRIPQEAIIGITYAVSAAAAVILFDRAPEGAEHLQNLLVGSILLVKLMEVAQMALLYAAIGGVHYLLRRPMLAVSFHDGLLSGRRLNARFWDFLFYALFGLVVTSSVRIAGVLLVFAYLVVPAVFSLLYSERVGVRLLIGWGMGALVSLLGMAASVAFDLPSGAAIVCVFGLVLGLQGLFRGVWAR